MVENYFGKSLDESFCGVIYGLGNTATRRGITDQGYKSKRKDEDEDREISVEETDKVDIREYHREILDRRNESKFRRHKTNKSKVRVLYNQIEIMVYVIY